MAAAAAGILESAPPEAEGRCREDGEKGPEDGKETRKESRQVSSQKETGSTPAPPLGRVNGENEFHLAQSPEVLRIPPPFPGLAATRLNQQFSRPTCSLRTGCASLR